tara:strand:- start:741 stop:2060 length:1320 start_codon:yes stop_codon:yes gene_type:complete
MPSWKKIIQSGSQPEFQSLEINPQNKGGGNGLTTHNANLQIMSSGSGTQYGLLISASTFNGIPLALIQTSGSGTQGDGEFIYGKGKDGENSFRLRQGAGGAGAFQLYSSGSNTNNTAANEFIYANFSDPFQGGDSYVNYSKDSRSDAYFGVGTNNPSAHLHVSGNGKFTGEVQVGTSTVLINGNAGTVSASGAISASDLHIAGGGNALLDIDGSITASGNISASGTNHTLGGFQITDSSASGSLYLSGSLEFSPNELKPATSSSRIYNHKNDYMGDRLEFNGVPFGGTHYEQIHSNFIDDLNTGKVYMPIRDVFEQSIGYDDNIHRLATCSGSLVSLAFRLGNVGTSGGTLSFTLEKAPPSSLTGMTTVATETFVVDSGDKDYHTCFVRFDADATVAPGEIYAVAVQSDSDLGGNTYWSANMVWAWDYTSLPAHGTEVG